MAGVCKHTTANACHVEKPWIECIHASLLLIRTPKKSQGGDSVALEDIIRRECGVSAVGRVARWEHPARCCFNSTSVDRATAWRNQCWGPLAEPNQDATTTLCRLHINVCRRPLGTVLLANASTESSALNLTSNHRTRNTMRSAGDLRLLHTNG